MSRHWIWALIFSFWSVQGVYAGGATESESSKIQQALERGHIVHPRQDQFLGYSPRSFDHPDCANGAPYHLEGFCMELWSPHKLSGSVSLSYLSSHESPSLIHFVGTGRPQTGPGAFPIYHRYSQERSAGLDVPSGENVWQGLTLSARPRDWIFFHTSLDAGLTFNRLAQDSQPGPTWYHTKEAYGEIQFNSAVLSLGRRPIYWGQSQVGALLISDNSTSFDSIQLSTRPIYLPSFIGFLGAVKSEVFVAQTDSDRVHPEDVFFGLRLGAKPTANLEFNIAMLYQYGGKGVPDSSAADFAIEVLGGRRETGTGDHDVTDVFNRLVGGDIRWTFPDWVWPTSFYTEQSLEDCCGSFKDLIKKSYAYTYGASILSSSEKSALRLRLEYTRTPDSMYWHGFRTTAWTYEGDWLGSPVGRDSQRMSLSLGAPLMPQLLDLEFATFVQESQMSGNVLRESVRNQYAHYASEKILNSDLSLSFIGANHWSIQTGGAVTRFWNRGMESDLTGLDWSLSSKATLRF